MSPKTPSDLTVFRETPLGALQNHPSMNIVSSYLFGDLRVLFTNSITRGV